MGTNELHPHCDLKGHKSIIHLTMVWDFGQGIWVLGTRCYVISTHTTYLGKCVLIVEMNMVGEHLMIIKFNKDNLKNSSALSI